MATRFCFSRLTKCFYFLLFILLIWSCGTSNSNPSSTSSPLKVIAYYAGGADRIDDFNLEGVDQLIYSFLHLKGNRLALDNAAKTNRPKSELSPTKSIGFPWGLGRLQDLFRCIQHPRRT